MNLNLQLLIDSSVCEKGTRFTTLSK